MKCQKVVGRNSAHKIKLTTWLSLQNNGSTLQNFTVYRVYIHLYSTPESE